MLTITKRVESIVETWPLIKQGLDLDLINLSSLARHLRPQLETEIGERISEAAVLMALRRYQAKQVPVQHIRPQDFLGDMSLRSELSDLTYSNSPTLNHKVSKLAEHANPQSYLTVSRGLLQTSVIVHEDIRQSVERQLSREHLETKLTNLTAVTLHLKPGHDKVAGIIAYPLGLLAWRGIAVVDLVSTFDELILVLYDKDIEEAFRTLKHALR